MQGTSTRRKCSNRKWCPRSHAALTAVCPSNDLRHDPLSPRCGGGWECVGASLTKRRRACLRKFCLECSRFVSCKWDGYGLRVEVETLGEDPRFSGHQISFILPLGTRREQSKVSSINSEGDKLLYYTFHYRRVPSKGCIELDGSRPKLRLA